MSTFNTSMFESIKDALTKEENNKTTSNYADVLSLKIGNTYTLRLLPNINKPQETFFHYFSHGWSSFSNGKYISAVSPTTFGERDPIAEERYKILRMGSEEDKEKVKAVRRSEQWLVKVYVVEDPSNPENNGKVKVLRYGKQLDKIVKEAISGEDKDEFGAKIFDLGSKGVNFKIKVEKQAEFASYTSSRFTTANTDLKLTEAKQKEIYGTEIDLKNVFKVKSHDELVELFNEHYYCKTTVAHKSESLPPADEVIAEIAFSKKQVATVAANVDNDIDIDELLKDL